MLVRYTLTYSRDLKSLLVAVFETDYRSLLPDDGPKRYLTSQGLEADAKSFPFASFVEYANR